MPRCTMFHSYLRCIRRATSWSFKSRHGKASGGYVALQAYGVEEPAKLFPTAVPWRMLHAAQVERLVVRPDWRGSGAKDALLRTCDAYAARGYPVRIKTGSERVANHTFMVMSVPRLRRAPPTRYDSMRSTPMKRYARVLAVQGDGGMPQRDPGPAAAASCAARADGIGAKRFSRAAGGGARPLGLVLHRLTGVCHMIGGVLQSPHASLRSCKHNKPPRRDWTTQLVVNSREA